MEDVDNIFKKHKKMFEDADCVLLEEGYKTTTLKWKFICSCGNYHEIKPSDFKRGRRCPICSREKQRNGRLIKDKTIVDLFNKRDEKLISIVREKDENGSVLTYVKYSCPKNHISYKQYSFFRAGHKCRECGIETRALSNTSNEEYLIAELKKYNCEYVEGYRGVGSTFSYICFCGKETKGHLQNIRNGGGCGCKRGNLKGKEHHNYKPYLTDNDRKKTRNGTLGYTTWRKNIIARDSNSCVSCWVYDCELVVHHLNSFSVYVEDRTNLDNGVTLCRNCHREFHSMYGKESVTKEDFQDFIYCIKNNITW